MDFKPKLIIRDKKGQLILIKGKIQQQHIMILNIDALNRGSLNFIKERLFHLKSQWFQQNDSGWFQYLTSTNKSCGKKLCRESEEWHKSNGHLSIPRTSHQNPEGYTIFSVAHGTLYKREHISTQNKSQQIKENWSHNLHFVWQPWVLDTDSRRNDRKYTELFKLNTHYWIKIRLRQTSRRKLKDQRK